MNCPYCNNEMKKGYIGSRREVLSWTPENERKDFNIWAVSPHGVKLGKYSVFSGSKVISYCCESCNKVIIDVNENE